MINAMTIKRVLSVFLKMLAVFVILVLLLFYYLAGIMCANEVLEEIPSPDGQYKIVTFIRDCGATTSLSPQVSVLKKGKELSDRNKGNVFIGNKSDFVDAYWEDNYHVVIIHNCADSDIIKSKSNCGKIEITYANKTL